MESLIELCSMDAIAGNESNVRTYLKKQLESYVDEVLVDGLGSVIFHKKGPGPKVLFMAHMDEVGFIVKGINAKGLVQIVKVGGPLDAACHHQMMRITTDTGIVKGLLTTVDGSEKQFFMDLGVDSRDEVLDLGVQVGDMVCFDSTPQILKNNRVFSKALDDRIGCFALMEAVKRLKDDALECDAYFAFTSSEEVGTRGGKTSTHLVQPDFSFAVDVASEKKGIPKELNTRILGQGFMLINYDKTLSPNRTLIKMLRQTAQIHDIKYQDDMMGGGGTDAGSSHLVGSGRLSAALGIPLRECHGPYSLCDLNDVEAMVSMITALCQSITPNVLEAIKEA